MVHALPCTVNGDDSAVCFFVPVTLTFDLEIQTLPSKGPNMSSLWIWLKSVQQFPKYFIHKQKKTKVTDSTKNRTLLACGNYNKVWLSCTTSRMKTDCTSSYSCEAAIYRKLQIYIKFCDLQKKNSPARSMSENFPCKCFLVVLQIKTSILSTLLHTYTPVKVSMWLCGFQIKVSKDNINAEKCYALVVSLKTNKQFTLPHFKYIMYSIHTQPNSINRQLIYFIFDIGHVEGKRRCT